MIVAIRKYRSVTTQLLFEGKRLASLDLEWPLLPSITRRSRFKICFCMTRAWKNLCGVNLGALAVASNGGGKFLRGKWSLLVKDAIRSTKPFRKNANMERRASNASILSTSVLAQAAKERSFAATCGSAAQTWATQPSKIVAAATQWRFQCRLAPRATIAKQR